MTLKPFRPFITHLLGSVLLVLSMNSFANLTVGESSTTHESVAIQKDGYGRDTPRGTVQGFISALSQNDDELALRYLDDGYINKKKVDSAKLLQDFRHSLDVGGDLSPMLQINDTQAGDTHDLLPNNQDKVGKIRTDDKTIDVLLIQKEAKDGTIYWQFSQETLQNLPKDLPQSDKFINQFIYPAFEGVQLGDFDLAMTVALLILFVIGLSLSYLFIWVCFYLSKLFYEITTKKQFNITPKVIMPLSVVLLATLLPYIMLYSGVPVTLRVSALQLKEVLAWTATAWLVMRLIDAIFGRAERISIKKNRPEQVSFLGLFRRLAKVFMVILTAIIIIGNLGFDLTTWIAALGIGGIALAFGAQKTIENLIGSVVVVADRPIHIGDYCKFDNYEGTVIDIGIRSTRIRTLNRTVVTVPNGQFSALQIENYATRDMFHFLHNLYLKRDVDPKALKEAIAAIKDLLDEHEFVNNEWTQVRICEMRQDCFVVEMRAYIITTNVVEFYDKQTSLIIQILELLQSLNVPYALPSQSVAVDLAGAGLASIENTKSN